MSSPPPVAGPAESLFVEARRHAHRAAVLASVEAVLGWDEQTMLPRAAAGHRADQAAELAAIVHAHRTDPAQGDRLHALASGPLATGGTVEEQAAIRLLVRDYEKQARLPRRLVEELARTGVEAQQAWAAARAASNWPALRPLLERMFALKREQAACQRPDLDRYDALLDDYEPGARSSDIAARFAPLREGIVALVRACVESPRRPDDRILTAAAYPVERQERFVRAVASRIGFDFDRGRLDTTAHPFCSTLGPDDCRITTRWNPRSLATSLYGVLHEAGHGLYEQGLPCDWFGLPPGEAASLGVHESQSRLWENLVGRSAAFWEWCLPLAQETFPDSLAGVDVATVHDAVLAVRPSFIRVEADEVTYNLHIMLRFDLERRVIRDELAVADLPAAWNDRFEADFGMRPPDDAHGVLQDIHWSAGLIGYFPTYALGNIYAAALMAAARRRFPDLDAEFATGRFDTLLGWLRREVHAAGRTLPPEELITRATGAPVDVEPLLVSLRERYGPAHGL